MLSKLLPVLFLFCLNTFAPGIFPLFPLYEDVTSIDCVTSVKTAVCYHRYHSVVEIFH